MEGGWVALALGLAGIASTLAAGLLPNWLAAREARRSARRDLYVSMLVPLLRLRARAEVVTSAPERHADEPVPDDLMHELEAQVTVTASPAVTVGLRRVRHRLSPMEDRCAPDNPTRRISGTRNRAGQGPHARPWPAIRPSR